MKKSYVIKDERIDLIVQDLRKILEKTKFSDEEIEVIIQEAIEKEEEKYFCTAEEARAEISKALNKDISVSTFRRLMTDYGFITKKKSNKTGLYVAVQSVDEYIEYSQYKTHELIAQIKALKEQLKEKDFQLMDEESRNGKLQEEVEKYKTILQEQTAIDEFIEEKEKSVVSSKNEEIKKETSHENIPNQHETKNVEDLSVEESPEKEVDAREKFKEYISIMPRAKYKLDDYNKVLKSANLEAVLTIREAKKKLLEFAKDASEEDIKQVNITFLWDMKLQKIKRENLVSEEL